MEVFTAATLAAIVGKFVSFLKSLTNRDWNAALTQVIVWAVGIAVVCVAAQADVADHIAVWGQTALKELDGWSQVIAGIALGSGFSAFYDLKKGLDGSDSATEPPLTTLGSGSSST